MARGTAGRPKWRITAEALAAFELGRESGAPAPKAARLNMPTDGVLNFY